MEYIKSNGSRRAEEADQEHWPAWTGPPGKLPLNVPQKPAPKATLLFHISRPLPTVLTQTLWVRRKPIRPKKVEKLNPNWWFLSGVPRETWIVKGLQKRHPGKKNYAFQVSFWSYGSHKPVYTPPFLTALLDDPVSGTSLFSHLNAHIRTP